MSRHCYFSFLLLPPPLSLALTRFREFLVSDLLNSMYGDTISSMGSKSTELPYILMEDSRMLTGTQSSILLSLHISRQDAFSEVMRSLASVVCRYRVGGFFIYLWRMGVGLLISGCVPMCSTLLVVSERDPSCVKGFLEPLGNLLYTTETDNM